MNYAAVIIRTRVSLAAILLALISLASEKASCGALSRDITITIKPDHRCVNPVFEFTRPLEGDAHIALRGRPLPAERQAWDGQTLWLDATIETPAELRVTFGGRVLDR